MPRRLILSVTVLLFMQLAFCQDEFIGKWKIESIGNKTELQFEHYDDKYMIGIGDNFITQDVDINVNENSISIPVFFELCDSFRYVKNEDGTIDLYTNGDLKIDIFGSVVDNIKSLENINSVTDEAMDKLIESILDAFKTVPIMRFRKISD